MKFDALKDISAVVQAPPLVVDLDGTLVKSDLLIESAFAALGNNPASLFGMLGAYLRGKPALKSYIAERTDIDVAHLPYDGEVLALIQQARNDGREVYLASATHKKYVEAVANHLGVFTGWFASDETINLSGSKKAARLVAEFGEKGFDYIGNDAIDLKVWPQARECIAVNAPGAVRSKLKKISPNAVVLKTLPKQGKAWIKLLRVHQWAKNGLVMVPVLTSQSFSVTSITQAVAAFFAFSLAASSIYIINDLVDIDADRQHPSKKRRPLAAGTVPILPAMIAAPILLVASLVGAYFVNPLFLAVLTGYLVLTTLYTFSLKRKLLVDVVALAGLYTIRVVGGAAAISVVVSEWLLAFSVFVFTALALIKRYTELTVRFDQDLPDPTNRNYRKADLPIVATLAAAAGFNAVTVFALYVSDDKISQLYANPKLLWLICPLLLYWLGRCLMLAHRRDMNDDPIVFALKDRNSLLTVAACGVVMLAAMIRL
ncbi:UbiA family prenyltransferase [Asticcacaulis endophyticus]|uniref:Membrane protein n=1 Tax=Asticcacaulis endophyticus TaxID=1395890 RepID=A0A918Q1J4_9CAUL|nr:UbiA family prenyltransferase [Asticcacaulis endophyticus]GGZ30550.1 membrane protein [Asticcacaulis endophyticus]